MNYRLISTMPGFLQLTLAMIMAASLMLITACTTQIPPVKSLEMDPGLQQVVFKTPEQAAASLVQAISDDNEEDVKLILGHDYRDLLPADGLKDEDIKKFLSAWDKEHHLVSLGENKKLLTVGVNGWTFPVPITKGQSGWYYNIEEGYKRILIRRIGRNELAAMQAVLAYYDAQFEYAQKTMDKGGILHFAQKFISTPGKHDGLYWTTNPGEELSPLGTLFADRRPGGGYHGYYYRILTAQGKDATGGAYNYIIGNKMRAGFALIAWPMNYGTTGVMSFMISHEGIVYERDLGPDTAEIAENMKIYDPGKGWRPAAEVNSIQQVSRQ